MLTFYETLTIVMRNRGMTAADICAKTGLHEFSNALVSVSSPWLKPAVFCIQQEIVCCSESFNGASLKVWSSLARFSSKAMHVVRALNVEPGSYVSETQRLRHAFAITYWTLVSESM